MTLSFTLSLKTLPWKPSENVGFWGISCPFPLLGPAMNATLFFTTTLFLQVEFIVHGGSGPKSGSVTIVLGNVPGSWICLIVSLTLFFDIQYDIIYYYPFFCFSMFVLSQIQPVKQLFCVLLTCPHHSFSSSLLSGTRCSRRISCCLSANLESPSTPKRPGSV